MEDAAMNESMGQLVTTSGCPIHNDRKQLALLDKTVFNLQGESIKQ